MKRLHILIDGKKGKDIAVVFIRAKIDGLITRYPTMSELNSEFKLAGTWQGIAKYFTEDYLNTHCIDISNIEFN